jgi:hypothetical protein
MTPTKIIAIESIYSADHPPAIAPELPPLETAWDLHTRLNRIRGLIVKEIRERDGADLNLLLAAEENLTARFSAAVAAL